MVPNLGTHTTNKENLIFMSFENFIAELQLRYFRSNELLINTERAGNIEPPSEMWNNIVPTILILDKLRDCLGLPIHLFSVYRAPDYNNRGDVGGVPLSQHQAFAAADIRVPALADRGVSLRTIYDWLRLWQDRWFDSPVPIETHQVTVPAGEISHAPLNTREEDGIHSFQFRGYLAYGGTYVHIDTRGTNDSEDLT